MRTGPCKVLALLVGVLVAASARADDAWPQRLDAALGAHALRGARTSALVVEREGGAVVYAKAPDRALVPASNQKVLTAVAALSALGPAHRFETRVLADAPPDAQGAVDWLLVQGGGDPALTSEEWWRLAADLRRLGLRRVRKGLWLDAGAFDDERWHPSWAGVSARAYHAPVAALSANYGAFAVSVRPGAGPGEPARVELDPPVGFLRLESRVLTGPARSQRRLAVQRNGAAGLERVVVSGAIPAGDEPAVYYRSVADPVRYAGSVLRMQLAANGIAVGEATRLAGTPGDAAELLVFEGKPLAEIVRLFVKYSNNTIAEGLVKALGVHAGGRGSWKDGIAAVRDELAELGIGGEGLVLVDGSGLSTANRVSPRTLVSALVRARESFRFGPELVASLPIAAADGTLEERAGDAALAVRAKTGLLTGVSSLSGYARRGDGRELVFSVLTNGYRGSAEGAMAALDRFAAELAQGPPPTPRTTP